MDRIDRVQLEVETDPPMVFQVPLTVSGIQYGQYLDYLVEKEKYDKLPELVRDAAATSNMLAGLRAIVEGPLDKLPPAVKADIQVKGKIPSIFSGTLTLLKLHNHVQKLIANYTYPDGAVPRIQYTFKFKGVEYVVGRDQASAWVTKMAFTSGEVIETVEMDSVFNAKIKKDGDPLKSIKYQRDLVALAILARPVGEALPSNVLERVEMIEARSVAFQELPMDIVLNVRFFLTNITQELKLSHYTFGFSTLLKAHRFSGPLKHLKQRQRGTRRWKLLANMLLRK